MLYVKHNGKKKEFFQITIINNKSSSRNEFIALILNKIMLEHFSMTFNGICNISDETFPNIWELERIHTLLYILDKVSMPTRYKLNIGRNLILNFEIIVNKNSSEAG